MAEALANDVLLYLEILVNEVGAVDAVCHDTAYESGGEEHVFRLLLIEKTAYGDSVQQVEFFMGFAYEVGVAFLLQVFPDGGTYQSAMPCDVYFCVLV